MTLRGAAAGSNIIGRRTSGFRAGVVGAGTSPGTDLFLVMGQSNAEGRGSSVSSPSVAENVGIEMNTSGTIVANPIVDPVGGANTGSAWPAWCNEWNTQTGIRAAIVELGTSGSSLIEAAETGAGSDWSPTGALRAAAVTAGNACITTLQADADYPLRNVYVIWVQGEADAGAENGTTVTSTEYESDLETLAAYFAANLTVFTKMGVVMLGTTGTGGGLVKTLDGEIQDYHDFRLAQKNACDDSSNLTMLFEGRAGYMGAGNVPDGTHDDQTLLNLWGLIAAGKLAGKISAPTLSSPLIANDDYTDANTANKATRTQSHTTDASTKCLILAIVCSRFNSATGFTLNGVSDAVQFNSVDMVHAGFASSISTGNIQAHLWYLNESDYGGDLGNVTGNLFVDPSSTQNVIHLATFESDVELMPADVDGNFSVSADTNITHTQKSILASLAIVVAGSNYNSTSATTTTPTGYTGTVDGVLANHAAGKTVHFLAGYNDLTAEDTASPDITFGATQQEIVACSVCFRAKYGGE